MKIEYAKNKELFYSHNIYHTLPHTGSHMHNSFEIYLLVRGDIEYFINDKIYSVTDDDLIITNSNEFHSVIFKSQQVYERYCIRFTPCFLSDNNAPSLSRCFILRSKGEQNIIHLSKKQKEDLLCILNAIDALALDNSCFERDILFNTYFIQLIVAVNKFFTVNHDLKTNKPLPETINSVISYINECINYEERIDEIKSIDRIARHFYINPDYLRIQFKKYAGISLYKYILHLKILKAKKYLENGKSVTSVCYMCGFDNYCSFIRTFKNICKITPGQYKKQCV